MVVKFYGTRGSLPVCETGYQEFGGNTTCVAIYNEEDGGILVFDAGTGIRSLGKDIMSGRIKVGSRITICFSHFHWDHIQGFPFFDPAYDPGKEIRLIAFGEELNVTDLREIFARQMEGIFFPIGLDDMGAKFTFDLRKISQESFKGGKLLISPHSHPGGAHGYRLEVYGKTVVFCTDVEHGFKIDPKVVKLARDADLLIHEAQFTPEELPNFRGWGHSSWEQAIEVAEMANVKQLYLTHHDPDHDDEFLREVERKCQERFPNCFLARDKAEIVI